MYRFMETESQKYVVLDGNQIPKRDTILKSFFTKLRSQITWGAQDMRHQDGKGGVRHDIEETFKMWSLNSSNFYLSLEEKLRKSKTVK